MAKIKLGTQHPNIKHTVNVTSLHGDELAIPIEYRYRTAKGYAKLMDDAGVGVDIDAAMVDGKFSALVFTGLAIEKKAKLLGEILADWVIDETPCTPENIAALCDEFPQAADKIVSDYRTACLEGKLGN